MACPFRPSATGSTGRITRAATRDDLRGRPDRWPQADAVADGTDGADAGMGGGGLLGQQPAQPCFVHRLELPGEQVERCSAVADPDDVTAMPDRRLPAQRVLQEPRLCEITHSQGTLSKVDRTSTPATTCCASHLPGGASGRPGGWGGAATQNWWA